MFICTQHAIATIAAFILPSTPFPHYIFHLSQLVEKHVVKMEIGKINMCEGGELLRTVPNIKRAHVPKSCLICSP